MKTIPIFFTFDNNYVEPAANAFYSLLNKAKVSDELYLIEIKCSVGAREDLGRPTTTPINNKKLFMNYILYES